MERCLNSVWLVIRASETGSLEMSRSTGRRIMKIVVIDGTGYIGSKLVKKLSEHGHEAVAAAPGSGVKQHYRRWTRRCAEGASVVVDVTNSPSWQDALVLTFFETSTRNFLASGAAVGVSHHVVLSVVGRERLLQSEFLRAQLARGT
jgi:uncharacterized protein YbjT (DUF2867 family)